MTRSASSEPASSAPVDEETAAPRRGRPRSAETERAIVDATLELLVEEGYGGMSMEGVAARAGVGKAAIYRRWPSKAELVVEALRGYASAYPLPDTGDFRADLLTMLEASQSFMVGREGAIMQAFAAEKARYPDLREQFEITFIAERRAHLHRLVERAIEQGQLPADTDIGIFTLVGPAVLAHHLLMHHHPEEPDMPQRIVDFLVPPRR
ncbi:TetR/AcrR family transcriptional regulator [Aquihabitans sp. G128]|uniref:TetR/AcrR family transcriptional regulator n=1 Tax=Aquihabitans sp. G128 TaxID=2849779 RepID=UPI001C250FE1|nr:TetR/AcrR family transcriptional regulator [Aquihabitans sp. G128]QXC63186.1 TetR/AcrR family transcriptional regulator [Aquihabitans sp. G128]